MIRSKLRWGDTLDDDDLMPPSQVEGPDEHGVKKVIEFVKNDKGDAVKRTTKIKIVFLEKKVYEVTSERAKWSKFGAAANEIGDQVTMRGEDIPFERIRHSRSTDKEKKASAQQAADKPGFSGNLKELLYKKRMERELLKARGQYEEIDQSSGLDGKAAQGPAGKSGKYVPPSRKGDTEGPSARRHEENAIRVSNLPEGVVEGDLRDLCNRFGNISRVYIATDPVTKASRGFAFINFFTREAAQKALALNGYLYDNVVLKVEWAERKEPR